MNTLQTNYSSATGLLPDFVVNSVPQPAAANFLEGPEDGKYYYNACRTPMRIVMDYAHFGTASSKTAVNKIITWAKGAAITNGNPASFRAGYNLNGTNLAGNNYQAAVFIAPIVAAATCDAAHQSYLNAGWDVIKNLKQDYFNDTYNLMTMLYISGNWWPPYDCGVTLNLIEDSWNESDSIDRAQVDLFSDSEHISIYSHGKWNAEVALMSVNGVMVASQPLIPDQNLSIPLGLLPSGIYVLNITTHDRIMSRRLVVSRQ
jgi:hypothetical protein